MDAGFVSSASPASTIFVAHGVDCWAMVVGETVTASVVVAAVAAVAALVSAVSRWPRFAPFGSTGMKKHSMARTVAPPSPERSFRSLHQTAAARARARHWTTAAAPVRTPALVDPGDPANPAGRERGRNSTEFSGAAISRWVLDVEGARAAEVVAAGALRAAGAWAWG